MKPKFHPRSSALLSLPVATAIAAILAVQAGHAQILWSSSGGSAWLTGSNWTGSSVPTSTQVAQFGVNPTGAGGVGINFASTTNAGVQTNGQRIQEVGAIEITSARIASSFLVGNSSATSGATGTLLLTGATVDSVANTILRNSSTQLLTIQNTQGTGNQTMVVELGNATDNIIQITNSGGITISSDISGTDRKLTREGSGAGLLILSGTNSYTGGTDINAGLVQFTNTASMPSTGDIAVGSGGGLIVGVGGAGRFTSASSGAGSFGGILSGIGAGGNAITYAGDVTVGIDISGGGATTYSDVIADVAGSTSTSLYKINGQNLTLTGANTYSGKTILGGGSVVVSSFGNIGDASSPLGTGSTIEFLSGGNLSFNGSTVQSSDKIIDIATGANATLRADGSGAGTITLTADINPTGVGSKTLSLFGANANANTISGNISNGAGGTLGITKSLAGRWVLAGTNTYSGATSILGGNLTLASTGSIDVGGTTTIGRLSVVGNGTFLVDGGSATFRGSGTGDNNAMLLGNDTAAGNITVQNDGSLSLSNGRFIMGGGNTANASNSGPTSVFTQTSGTTTTASNAQSYIGNIMPATMAISGGTFSAATASQFIIGVRSNTTLTVSGTDTLVTLGELRFGLNGAGAGVANTNVAVNLDGGALAVSSITVNGVGNRTHAFNFDGGTLTAREDSASFFSTGTDLTASVKAGGGTIDNSGFAITVGQRFLTDTVSTGGGMTFKGDGTTTLTGLSTFTGNLAVDAGTVVAGVAGTGGNSALGAVNHSRTITVNTGGTLRFDVGNVFNNVFSSPAGNLPALNINGGTMTNGGTATNSALGNITLTDGTLTATTGAPVGTESGQGWGSWNLNGTITSTGDSTISSTAPGGIPMTLSATGSNNYLTTFDVQGEGDTLTASAPFANVTRAGNETVSGLIKTGLGTMILSGSNSYTGATTVSAGTLLVNGSLGNSAVTVDPLAIIGGAGSIGGSLAFAANSFLRVADFDVPLAVVGGITFGSGFGIANLLGIDWDSLDLNTAYTAISTTQTFSSDDIADFGVANAVSVGDTGRLAYFSNSGLSVVVIPEPSAALLGGLGLLVLLRRRRY